jgi:putative transposase
MAQRARNMCMFFADEPQQARYLVCDRGTKFTAQFRVTLESDAVEIVQTAIRSPNQNAYAERFAQTIKQECLDNFIILGEKHLRYLVREYVRYYHTARAPIAREPAASDGRGAG